MPKQNKMMQLVNCRLRLTLQDGRTMVGQLLAYDKHLNLVLADCEETRRTRTAEQRRTLGLVMLRGCHIISMAPEGGPGAEDNKTRTPAATMMGPGAGRAAGKGVPPPGAPRLVDWLVGCQAVERMNVMAAKIPSLVVLAFLAILPLCQAATISADAVALMAAAGVGLDDSPLNQPATPLTLPELGDIPVTDKFWTSFFTALLMIMVSELGDKTFLIAAIMAMRHSRVVTFVASLGALALMTIISAAFGLLLPNLIPRKWTLWGAAILFAVFGLKMLVEAFSMSAEHMRDEYDEVSHEIEDSEDMTRRREVPRSPSRNLEGGGSCSDNSPLVRLLSCFYALRIGQTLSPVAMQTFSLTFLAEWGDRSQIATIALAAAQNVYGVATGAIMGHAVCTALAVLSGKLMATVMSIRTVTALGGFSFIVFAIFAIL